MNAVDGLHFIRPLWLYLLPVALLLPWWWRRSRRPSGDWLRVCDPHLLRWLSVREGRNADRPAWQRALARSGPWLAGLALAVATLALAGPSWQKLPDTSFSARDARVIALDLSRSMLAEDLRPNRLTRARFRLADLLSGTEEGQVGLVAFAGDAFVVSPLTNDMNTIANLLPALQPDIIPVAGSRADHALDLAADLLQRSGLSGGQVLLVTDSADSRDAAKARELRDRGVVTSVLAVGTPEGAPIPSGGGFVNDRAGNVVIARLDRSALQQLADAGGGRYSELGASAISTDPWLDQESSEFTRRDDALGERWRDVGPWLVLLLLPVAVVAFRRGLFFVLPLLLSSGLLMPRDAAAGWWEDLWMNDDQQAWQALSEEDPARAAALANDPALAGEAWYRSQEFANAQEAWNRQPPSADAHYNRGNALAHLGEYDAAIEAYDQALALQPDMEDALHNREVLEQLKQEQERRDQEQQEQQGQQGDQSQQQSDQGESSESGEQQEPSDSEGQQEEGAESQDGEQQEGQAQQGDEQQGEPSSEYAENWSEEDAQAMEQWLRRIPDDPGGLLRRKFRNEYLRRGAPEDENQGW